jgi:arginyl-tRNA--protein-N-Asp/Glu arginylyltransferase
MNYLSWKTETISDFSPAKICEMYEKGYVFTRVGKGVMKQTRSVRISLENFELSSENRRILKKTDGLTISMKQLPFADYNFQIGKLAKDFYDTKFAPGTMSAQKVKEMMTDGDKSNFNALLTYTSEETTFGYTICYSNQNILHYSYPFYDLQKSPKDMGLGMMIRAISLAKSNGIKHIYLGSLQRPSDTYKLQFAGLEWFDGNVWQSDIDLAKETLKTEPKTA